MLQMRIKLFCGIDQLGTGLEFHYFSCRNLDTLASLWIAALASGAIVYRKGTKTNQRNFVTSRNSIGYRAQYTVQYLFC